MPTHELPLAPGVSAAAPSTDQPTLSTVRTVVAIVALALGGFAIGTTEFVTMGLLPDIADGVGVDIPSAGHLISAYAVGVVIGAPVIAAFSARFPRRACSSPSWVPSWWATRSPRWRRATARC